MMKLELVIEAAEHPDKPPAVVRIRRALKSLWRSYGLKVKSYRHVNEQDDQEHDRDRGQNWRQADPRGGSRSRNDAGESFANASANEKKEITN